MRLTLLLVVCLVALVNGKTNFKLFKSILTRNVNTDDAPLLKSRLTEDTESSKTACLRDSLNSHMVVMETLAGDQVQCSKYSLDAQGEPHQFLSPGLIQVDKEDWLEKADFTWERDMNTVGGSPAVGITGNGATAFNGVDDHINLGNQRQHCFGNLNICPNGVSFSFWLKITNVQNKAYTPEDRYILSSGAQTGTSHGIAMYYRNGEENLPFKTDTQSWLNAKFPLILERWHHVIASWEQSAGLRIYVNGDLVSSDNNPVATSHSGSSNDFTLGIPNNNMAYTHLAEFILDDFKVFYRFLDENNARMLFIHRYSQ